MSLELFKKEIIPFIEIETVDTLSIIVYSPLKMSSCCILNYFLTLNSILFGRSFHSSYRFVVPRLRQISPQLL